MTDLPDGPRKPRIYDACNGCGLCCAAEACAIALAWIDGADASRACPALEWQDGRFWCGMVRHPFSHSIRAKEIGVPEAVFGESISEFLGGVGGGCDSGPEGSFMEDRWAGWTAREYRRLVDD